MKFLIPVFLFFLQGCVSTSAVWKDKKYKPVKKGTIFYSAQPNLFDGEAVQKRRMDAKMKMADFCSPEKPTIVSEKNKEEVTGHYTSYSSSRDNPNPSYYSKSKTYADRGSYVSSSSTSQATKSLLHSSGSQTTSAITRKRVYIDFVCQ